jgi:hypothetical protein
VTAIEAPPNTRAGVLLRSPRYGWLLVVAACSRPTPLAVDAQLGGDSAEADAGTDAAIDAAVGPIAITVFTYGDPTVPLANAKVEFQAGTTQTVMTDINGVATAIAPAGTTVVVYQTGEGGYPLVKSFADAQPGDSINAGGWPQQTFPALGDIQFSVPPVVGASSYSATISCAAGSNPATLRAHVLNCPNAHDAIAFAWALDDQGRVTGAWSMLQHIDLAAVVGTTVTLPSLAGVLVPVTAEISNLPPGSTNLEWEESYFLASDRTVSSYASSLPPSLQLLELGDRSQSTFHFTPPGFDAIRYDRVDASRIADFQLDATSAVRAVTNVHFDVPTRSIHWTESTSGTPAALLNVTMSVSSAGHTKVEIQLHAPHGASIPLPTLPQELTPVLGDSVILSSQFQSIQGMSYDASMQVVDTHPGFTPIFWDPTFVGAIWEAD